MSSPALPSCALLGGFALLAGACGEPGVPAAAEVLGVLDRLPLTDAANARATLDVEIEQQEVAARTDIVIDWSALAPSAWPAGDTGLVAAERASLRFFPDLDLAALTEGLAAGTLVQSDVGLDLYCASEERTCALSEFEIAESHALDTVALFGEGQGTWLVSVYAESSAEVVAYLALRPTVASAGTLATLSVGSSTTEVSVAPSAGGPLPVPADGYVEVDWTGISHTTRGLPIQPYQVDRLVLSFLRGVDPAAPGSDLATRLEAATEVWTADVAGDCRFALPELVEGATGEVGFPGFEGEGAWVLTLWASSTGDPSPVFLSVLRTEPVPAA